MSQTPQAEQAFSSLPLSAEFLDNLKALGYNSMTPIQAQALPEVLNGKDIQAQAKTGSGKTAAFGIALLHRLDSSNYQTQALVLCPTRELADQVSEELRRLARAIPNTKIISLCGGKPIGPQFASLEHQPHIVVGTPGRILKHLDKGTLKLASLNTLVLDEGDRMLDMGFYDDIMRVIEKTPENRQTLLFSATYPKEIKKISRAVQKDPVTIEVESVHDSSKIKQVFFEVHNTGRSEALVTLLQHYQPEHSLVFCNRKQQCKELAEDLWRQGIHAVALHGDLEQKDRDRVLIQFANRSSSVLIATDVAARGLDIKDLNAVINYELTPDPEVHIHRIGRTGRGENEGLALSLFAPSEAPKLVAIENYQQLPLEFKKIDSLKRSEKFKLTPPMVTLCIYAGRKNKVRAGDVLGALTADKSLSGKQIGKINILDTITYVAIEQASANKAMDILTNGKIKAKKFKVKKLK